MIAARINAVNFLIFYVPPQNINKIFRMFLFETCIILTHFFSIVNVIFIIYQNIYVDFFCRINYNNIIRSTVRIQENIIMRKIISVLLVVIFLFALAAPVFASTSVCACSNPTRMCDACFGQGRQVCILCRGTGTASWPNAGEACRGCYGGYNQCLVCKGSGQIPTSGGNTGGGGGNVNNSGNEAGTYQDYERNGVTVNIFFSDGTNSICVEVK